jgi:hypothetical protein
MLFSLSCNNFNPEGNFFFSEDTVGVDDDDDVDVLPEVGGLSLASGVRENHDQFTMMIVCYCDSLYTQ